MSGLYRIRWQETWGDQLQGVHPDPILSEETAAAVSSLAYDWFPQGSSITPDPDSPHAWKITSRSDPARVLWLFIEPITSA